MKLLRYAAFITFLMPASAYAQCSGIFSSGFFCGNKSASSGIASAASPTDMFDRAFGGTNNSTIVRIGGTWTVLSSANNAIWATSGAGVPSLTQSLPSAVQLSIGSFNSGTSASSTTFWRGDGIWGVVREVLSSNRDYYVRTDGNDNCNGLVNSSGSSGACAFLTIQKGVTVINNTLDLAGNIVTIHVNDGTYTAATSCPKPTIGGVGINITGNTGTPGNVLLNVTGVTFDVSNYCVLNLSGFKLQATGTVLNISNYGTVNIPSGAIEFGASGTIAVLSSFAKASISGNITISGSSPIGFHITDNSLFRSGAGVWTLTGTPAFSTFFFGTSENSVSIWSNTFSGAATGSRCFIHQGALVEGNTSSLDPSTYFPGSTPCNFNGGNASFNEATPVHSMLNFSGPPGTPVSGVSVVYTDATTKKLCTIDDAALVSCTIPGTTRVNSLASDVTLNNTANYFDGPQVTQGASGTWLATGTVTLEDTAGSSLFYCKLWDGSTIAASASINTPAATGKSIVALSGILISPAGGNIRVSCRDVSSTSGFIRYNVSGNAMDSTITVLRLN